MQMKREIEYMKKTLHLKMINYSSRFQIITMNLNYFQLLFLSQYFLDYSV